MKKGSIIWLTYLMLALQLISCNSSLFETRLVSNRIERVNARNLDRRESSERVNVRSYKVLATRTSPNVNVFSYAMEDSGTTKQFNGINFNERKQKLGRTSNFRRINRLNDKNRRLSFPNLRYKFAAKTQLSNEDVSTFEISKNGTDLAKSCNRIDYRNTKNTGNRLPFRVRDNRFRENFSSKKSITPNQRKSERMSSLRSPRGTHNLNRQHVRLVDVIEPSKIITTSKSGEVRNPMLENRKRDVMRQRSDRFERAYFRNRDHSRYLQSQHGSDDLTTFRRDRNFLVSRKELRMSTGERIRLRRQIQNRLQTSATSGVNLEERSGNRRNGRGYRGRVERQSSIERRRDNMATTDVRFSNHQLSDGKTFLGKHTERKSHRLFNSRNATFSMYQQIKVELEDLYTVLENNENLVTAKCSGENFRRYEARSRKAGDSSRSRKAGDSLRSRKASDNLRSRTLFQVRRLNVRIKEAKLETDMKEGRKISPGRFAVVRAREVVESLLRIRSENNAVRYQVINERRVLSREHSFVSGLINQHSDQALTTSSNIALQGQFSNLRRDRCFGNSREQNMHRVGERINCVSRRIFVLPKSHVDIQKLQIPIKIQDDLKQMNIIDEHKQHFSVRHRRVVSFERKEGVSKAVRLSDEHNTRSIHLKRNVELKKNQVISNKERINSNKISKYTDGNNFVSRQLKQRLRTEYSAALRSRQVSRAVRRIENNRLESSRYGKVLRENIQKVVKLSMKMDAFTHNSTNEISSDKSRFTPSKKYIENAFNNLVSLKTPDALRESRRREQRVSVNYQIPTSYDQVQQSLFEYLSQKKSGLFSFAFNVILGISVIAAMSDDVNKGLIFRLNHKLGDLLSF